jgi:hypothetical protein
VAAKALARFGALLGGRRFGEPHKIAAAALYRDIRDGLGWQIGLGRRAGIASVHETHRVLLVSFT